MARLESVAVAGYYPTPASVIPAIAALLDPTPAGQAQPAPDPRWGPTYPTVALGDPAAGDGAALVGCAQALFGAPFPAPGKGPQVRLYAIELEGERAQALATRLRAAQPQAHHLVEALQSDSFQVSWATDDRAAGLHVLLLNPPYDLDPIHGRLEQAFLTRFTPALIPGSGLLIFIIPGYALAASAVTLATEYEDYHAYRFPDAEYAAFKQIVVLARRRHTPRTLPGSADRVAAQLTAWSRDPARLSVLPTPGSAPPMLALAGDQPGGFRHFAAQPLDIQHVLRYARPWAIGASDRTAPPADPPIAGARSVRPTTSLTPLTEIGLHQPLAAFLQRVLPVAMPPKPAYLALLLAAGLLNGLRVEPDDPTAGWPPILVKGRFKKDFVTVKENTDKKGRTTSQVQVQQPTLAVCLLALTDPPRYVDLQPGTTPTGATAVDAMNVADLLAHYGRGLAALMAAQVPGSA